MNLNELEISVETIIGTLSSRIAELERDKAMLIAQQEAIIKKYEEREGE